MSGPYGPNDSGDGRNDPTQQWGGQQTPGGAAPTQHWGGQQSNPAQAQPTQQWGGQPQQQWGQPQTGDQPQQQWNQPQTGGQPQQQWGQSQPQWGQQPQPQWGGQPQQSQPQWGQQPQPQWGQGQPPAPPSSGGKGKGLFIGLGVLAVLVIGAIIALVVVLTSKDKLDQAAVQNGVKKVLTDSYGIQDVADVSCPSGQEVKINATFECTLKVSGEQKKVNIKITNENGTYEVGRPS
ncbi:DUF4333 domain-containing protein [Nocardia bovistercoris]|uniref:DUF4333 domain-containing protein n=1 Tax=Nocardia bovistercoris TaxID=2785916 RepID=A0A931IG28_9NOCA|nr:DUF4333 domain-containing protein [Nocardia bovistercoris]MBH0779700.1 DUF4333 domain-containing protein [Nocardia bovistercoris]